MSLAWMRFVQAHECQFYPTLPWLACAGHLYMVLIMGTSLAGGLKLRQLMWAGALVQFLTEQPKKYQYHTKHLVA